MFDGWEWVRKCACAGDNRDTSKVDPLHSGCHLGTCNVYSGWRGSSMLDQYMRIMTTHMCMT